MKSLASLKNHNCQSGVASVRAPFLVAQTSQVRFHLVTPPLIPRCLQILNFQKREDETRWVRTARKCEMEKG